MAFQSGGGYPRSLSSPASVTVPMDAVTCDDLKGLMPPRLDEGFHEREDEATAIHIVVVDC